MVEKFGFDVHEITSLYLLTLLTNIFVAPVIGRIVGVFGERRALLFEYAGLVLVFSAYGGVYFFGWGVAIAATLYVIDHIFFALALALKAYFQKIADPQDITADGGCCLYHQPYCRGVFAGVVVAGQSGCGVCVGGRNGWGIVCAGAIDPPLSRQGSRDPVSGPPNSCCRVVIYARRPNITLTLR